MNVTEETLKSWASAPGQTEQTKCDNAVTAVQKAIDASTKLSQRNIKVFAQGSYRNRTNVKQDSDVDVCVLCTDTFFYDIPANTAAADFGIVTPASYRYSTYKAEVGEALKSYFGNAAINSGGKAFNIRQNTYRIDADAIACFEYRDYFEDGDYREGVAFIPDGKAAKTFNFPQQNYENGVAKNASAGCFKDIVRILKTLRYVLQDEGVEAAEAVPSFLVESLVWNVDDDAFKYPIYGQKVREVLAIIFNLTLPDGDCSEWTEVNDIKYLFHPFQPWTKEQAHDFVDAAWNYLGLE